MAKGEVGRVGLGILSGILGGIQLRSQQRREDEQRQQQFSLQERELSLREGAAEDTRQAQISQEAALPGLLKGQEARQRAQEGVQQRFAERGITSGPDIARLRTARGLEDIKTSGALTREAGKRFAQPGGGRTPADRTFAKETAEVSTQRNQLRNVMQDEFDIIERRIGPGAIEEAIRTSIRSQGTDKAIRAEDVIRESFAGKWAQDLFQEESKNLTQFGGATFETPFLRGEEINDAAEALGIGIAFDDTLFDLVDIAKQFVQDRKSETEFQQVIAGVMDQKFAERGGGQGASIGGVFRAVFGSDRVNKEGLTLRELNLLRGIALGVDDEEKLAFMQKLLAKMQSGTLQGNERKYMIDNPDILARARGASGPGTVGASQ